MDRKLKIITVEKDLLRKNNEIALKNRQIFDNDSIFTVNLLSSPGSGKTSVLEVLIPRLLTEINVSVIEGDVETPNDAVRINRTGADVVQITTKGSCHLNANMVEKAYSELDNAGKSGKKTILFIENVGNLVCPASFYLGEHINGVVLSVTEGDDKPIKYPKAFRNADFVIINKIDLLPYVDFSLKKSMEYIKKINNRSEIFEMSAKTGEGADSLISYFISQL